jgi:hypothetical protein
MATLSYSLVDAKTLLKAVGSAVAITPHGGCSDEDPD